MNLLQETKPAAEIMAPASPIPPVSGEGQAAPWSAAGMAPRRAWIFQNVRHNIHRFFDEAGQWLRPPGINATPDPRVMVQVCLPLWQGDERDRALARHLVAHELVRKRINSCSFTTEYLLAMLLAGEELVPADIRADLVARLSQNLLHYARQDLRHHGYNDNHVTLATSSLILGGELLGIEEAVEEGLTNLLNFRDTFLRRGFMHETNDCYIPHTLYSTAAVAHWAKDPHIRQLAQDCETRIWADWVGHWHAHLSRKPGPSARDYTGGRLDPLVVSTGLWCIFGEGFGQPAYPPQDVFNGRPAERAFGFNGNPSDGHWNLGFLARICAHPYHVPQNVAELMYGRAYPHLICGTHETGHFDEMTSRPQAGSGEREVVILPDAVPFSAREIFTYQWQEADWAMGTASQRMIGNCPNNNWSVVYRKAQPLQRTADQGAVYCSFTINDKRTTGNHVFAMSATDPEQVNKEDVEHWLDNGRYAAMQHERTSLVLYRPRVHERHQLSALSTTLVFPLCWDNSYEELWFGDERIEGFEGQSAKVQDIFVVDGPLFLGIKPLLSRPQAAPVRMKARREEFWATVDIYGYDGPALDLCEMDLCRVGGGFLCEVAPREEFGSLDDFKTWFRQGKVLDEQATFMRQVRYHRPGLDMGLRWDMWNDSIMWRMLNGRTMPTPTFHCTGLDPASLPWLTGDVSALDHFHWAERQAKRPPCPYWDEPGTILS